MAAWIHVPEPVLAAAWTSAGRAAALRVYLSQVTFALLSAQACFVEARSSSVSIAAYFAPRTSATLAIHPGVVVAGSRLPIWISSGRGSPLRGATSAARARTSRSRRTNGSGPRGRGCHSGSTIDANQANATHLAFANADHADRSYDRRATVRLLARSSTIDGVHPLMPADSVQPAVRSDVGRRPTSCCSNFLLGLAPRQRRSLGPGRRLRESAGRRSRGG